MARKIMAGTILVMVALAIGLTVDFGDDAEATTAYSGHRNIGNFAEILSDTTNATIGDSIVMGCEYVYRWSISTRVADVAYKFKIAGTDDVTNAGYLESTSSVGHMWEVAPEWIKVQAVTGSPRYTICVEGYEASGAAGSTIVDSTKVF